MKISANKYFTSVMMAMFLILSSVPSRAEGDLELLEKAVKKAKGVEGNPISDYRLTDQDGEEFLLGDYKGKPLLVSFIYTTCPDICNSVVATLAPAMEELKEEVGDSFNALIVGFDAEYDTPDMMKEFGLHHETDFSKVRFASGDAETISKMVNDFGFYFEEMEDGGFNHIGLVTVIDRDGIIYDQIYKTKIDAADLRVPVNQLLSGNIGKEKPPTLINKLIGLCLRYDPASGEYYVDYIYLFGVFLQALTIFLVAWFMLKEDMKRGFRKIFNIRRAGGNSNE